MWGWSHAPFLDGVIEGNLIEDALRGGVLGLEHDIRYIKSNQGRTYMTFRLTDNVVRWSDSFLRLRSEGKSGEEPLVALTLGHPGSHDPRELVVTASGNRLEAPARLRAKPALQIHTAEYNGERVVNRRVDLSASARAGRREAKAASTTK
jgi:hypothetical protein